MSVQYAYLDYDIGPISISNSHGLYANEMTLATNIFIIITDLYGRVFVQHILEGY